MRMHAAGELGVVLEEDLDRVSHLGAKQGVREFPGVPTSAGRGFRVLKGRVGVLAEDCFAVDSVAGTGRGFVFYSR